MPSIDINHGPYATQQEAQTAYDKLMSAYSPLAYGTSLSIKQTPQGWHVYGSRWSSSD